MPPRYDYGGPRGGERIQRPAGITEPGYWKGGTFHFFIGWGLADGEFVCPYGNHLVDISDECPEDHFYYGHCEVCQREVEIDYEPSEVVARGPQ